MRLTFTLDYTCKVGGAGSVRSAVNDNILLNTPRDSDTLTFVATNFKYFLFLFHLNSAYISVLKEVVRSMGFILDQQEVL